MKFFASDAKTNLQEKANKKIFSLMKEAEKKGWELPAEKGFFFEVSYNYHSVNCAGYAIKDNKNKTVKIKIHTEALELFGEKFIDDVVIHEFSHIIQFCNYPHSKSHGREFKHIVTSLGGSPERCHNYDLRKILGNPKKKKQKRFVYYCPECGKTFKVSKTIHNRITKKGYEYFCPICKTEIREK